MSFFQESRYHNIFYSHAIILTYDNLKKRKQVQRVDKKQLFRIHTVLYNICHSNITIYVNNDLQKIIIL